MLFPRCIFANAPEMVVKIDECITEIYRTTLLPCWMNDIIIIT